MAAVERRRNTGHPSKCARGQARRAGGILRVMKGHDLRGAYTADRASALSGVPKSTIHYWARHDILVPNISPERVKLWSYPDLMGLRTIYWLRQSKPSRNGPAVPATSMPAVRRALKALREDLDLELWTEERGPSVAVD